MADEGGGSLEVAAMVLAIFLPVLLLLFLLGMERLEVRLLPAESTAHTEDGVVDQQPDAALPTQLSIPAQTPGTGAVTLPAAAR